MVPLLGEIPELLGNLPCIVLPWWGGGRCHEGIRELGGGKNPARPKWKESGNRETPAEEEGRAHRTPDAGLCAAVWGHSYACSPVVCDSFCLTEVELRDEVCQPCTGIVLLASPLVASPSVI